MGEGVVGGIKGEEEMTVQEKYNLYSPVRYAANKAIPGTWEWENEQEWLERLAEEREACARVAESMPASVLHGMSDEWKYSSGTRLACDIIARHIRSRGEPPCAAVAQGEGNHVTGGGKTC